MLENAEKTIIQLIRTNQDSDAETLWLQLKSLGISMSIGSVYLKLNKMGNLGLIDKSNNGYRKSVYNVNANSVD